MSEGVTQTIFFVAAVVLATATVAMTYSAVQGMAGDVQSHAQVVGQRLRSDLRIVNDPQHVVTSPLTLYIKNIGSQTLYPELWTLLVDGLARTSVTYDVLGSADDTALREAEVVQAEVTGFVLGSGDHSVRVVAETGVEDHFTFYGG